LKEDKEGGVEALGVSVGEFGSEFRIPTKVTTII
jgi:hypothetical protein